MKVGWPWGFPGGSDGKEFAFSAGDLGSIPGWGRSPGEGNGNPLQYSGLENPMDRGASWATVPGIEELDTTEGPTTHTQGDTEGQWASTHGNWYPSKRGIWVPIECAKGQAHETIKGEIREMPPQAKRHYTSQTPRSWRGAWDRFLVMAFRGTNLTTTASIFQPPDRETTHFCCLWCFARTDLANSYRWLLERILFPWDCRIAAREERLYEFEKLRAERAVGSCGLSVWGSV